MYTYHTVSNFCGIIIQNFKEAINEMTKQEIIAKVNELINAPTVCAPLKAAAEAYAKDQSRANADALVKSLEENVNSLDETLAFVESDAGRKIFGEQGAADAAKMGHELKAKGGKYCFCPACQAGGAIYENRAAL